MQETQEDMGLISGSGRSLEKEIAAQYPCLGIPMAEESGGLQSMVLQLNDYPLSLVFSKSQCVEIHEKICILSWPNVKYKES